MPAVDRGQIPRAQYGALLIDEGHDFESEWLDSPCRCWIRRAIRCCFSMTTRSPSTSSIGRRSSPSAASAFRRQGALKDTQAQLPQYGRDSHLRGRVRPGGALTGGGG